MRISDWSSDVCSSDLVVERDRLAVAGQRLQGAQRGAARGLPLEPDVEPGGEAVPGHTHRQVRGDHHEPGHRGDDLDHRRSEEHMSELQSLMRISYAVFCLKKKITQHSETIFTEQPHN